MSRQVFFSFHYERDIVRANQVRNSWVTKGSGTTAGFWDKADWETVKRGGDAAVKNWIETQMAGTSVTVVLIGAETAERPYVLHEIKRSWELRKGLIGVRIHNLKNFSGQGDYAGPSPFNRISVSDHGRVASLSQQVSFYDYVVDDGFNNLDQWIEDAARAVGR